MKNVLLLIMISFCFTACAENQKKETKQTSEKNTKITTQIESDKIIRVLNENDGELLLSMNKIVMEKSNNEIMIVGAYETTSEFIAIAHPANGNVSAIYLYHFEKKTKNIGGLNIREEINQNEHAKLIKKLQNVK